MKKLILLGLLILLSSCYEIGKMLDEKLNIESNNNQSHCENRCEKYGTKKYGQIDIDKPSVTVDDKKYVEPWCFCMEVCLQLEEPYCNEDSTKSN